MEQDVRAHRYPHGAARAWDGRQEGHVCGKTKHVLKHRVSTLAELKAVKIVEVGEGTDVEGLLPLRRDRPKGREL